MSMCLTYKIHYFCQVYLCATTTYRSVEFRTWFLNVDWLLINSIRSRNRIDVDRRWNDAEKVLSEQQNIYAHNNSALFLSVRLICVLLYSISKVFIQRRTKPHSSTLQVWRDKTISKQQISRINFDVNTKKWLWPITEVNLTNKRIINEKLI